MLGSLTWKGSDQIGPLLCIVCKSEAKLLFVRFAPCFNIIPYDARHKGNSADRGYEKED